MKQTLQNNVDVIIVVFVFLYNVVFREDKTSQLVLLGYIVPFEEKYLAKEFPEEWQDYAANVKRYGIL